MYYGGGIGSIYDPSTYPQGVPNPYTPRVHAWGTREQNSWLAHGTRYHGPNYVRPMFSKPWQGRPLMGVGQDPGSQKMVAAAGLVLGVGVVMAVILYLGEG